MVTLGAHNIRKKEDTWQKLKVIKQFPHPKYDDLTLRHDIMLLKVIISFSPVSTSCSLSFLLQVPIALRYPSLPLDSNPIKSPLLGVALMGNNLPCPPLISSNYPVTPF